ncbi:hypothetical protein MKX79_14955 [Viridibacillus sp. FSL R5-0468]|uniref:hypothetical protein n=1 Tax=Viridibacillus sp. FSL R5-0468 TaxID=2921640 RepID=UPI0030F9CEDC
MPVLKKDSQSVKSILVSCDQCKTPFELSDYKKESVIQNHKSVSNLQSVEGINKDIEHTYFNCPSCGHTYTCYYTDEHIRTMQAKLRKVQRRQSFRLTAAKARQANELHQSIKQAMQLLRLQVETHDK